MDQIHTTNISTGLSPEEAIQKIHPALKLCGTEEDSLLDIADELSAYICSVLRGESPTAPDAAIEQWEEVLEILRANWVIPMTYINLAKISYIENNYIGVNNYLDLAESNNDHQKQNEIQSYINGLRKKIEIN